MNKQAVMSFASPLAGKSVRRAPEPTKLVAVQTPVACIPEVTWSSPVTLAPIAKVSNFLDAL